MKVLLIKEQQQLKNTPVKIPPCMLVLPHVLKKMSLFEGRTLKLFACYLHSGHSIKQSINHKPVSNIASLRSCRFFLTSFISFFKQTKVCVLTMQDY